MKQEAKRRKILKLFMTFVFACCLFVGVNPAEAGLISREQEIEMGQQTAKQLEAQYGVSQDAALQERVNRIGQRLAKVCGRDDITFSFKVTELFCEFIVGSTYTGIKF